MDAAEISQRLLEQYGIRVESEMSQYVLRRLQSGGQESKRPQLPVIGGDARTCVPARMMIDPSRILGEEGGS